MHRPVDLAGHPQPDGPLVEFPNQDHGAQHVDQLRRIERHRDLPESAVGIVEHERGRPEVGFVRPPRCTMIASEGKETPYAREERPLRDHPDDAGHAAAEAGPGARRADPQDPARPGCAPPMAGTRSAGASWSSRTRRSRSRCRCTTRRAFDEVVGPRYLSSAPPPGVSRERYTRQHTAVEYLTDHFHEAPVWIVACLDEGTATPTRSSGASIYPAVQNMLLAARALGLGSTLTTRHLLHEKDAEAALGLPPGVHSYAILPIGYPMGKFGPVGRGPARRHRVRGPVGPALPRSLERSASCRASLPSPARLTCPPSITPWSTRSSACSAECAGRSACCSTARSSPSGCSVWSRSSATRASSSRSFARWRSSPPSASARRRTCGRPRWPPPAATA